MTSNVFPMSSIKPCFLLSRPRFDFPQSVLLYTLYSFHNNYFNLAPSSFSAPGSRQLVCIAYYLVLRFLFMYSSSGLTTDVFPNKTNINTVMQTKKFWIHCSSKSERPKESE